MDKTNPSTLLRTRGFSTIAAVIIAAVALAMIGGGVWYYQSKKSGQVQPAQNNVSQQNIAQSQDKTADWKIYKNDKYGFEVKYPPNWTFSDFLNDFRYMAISFVPISPTYQQRRDIIFSCQGDNYSEDNFTASGEGNKIELIVNNKKIIVLGKKMESVTMGETVGFRVNYCEPITTGIREKNCIIFHGWTKPMDDTDKKFIESFKLLKDLKSLDLNCAKG